MTFSIIISIIACALFLLPFFKVTIFFRILSTLLVILRFLGFLMVIVGPYLIWDGSSQAVYIVIPFGILGLIILILTQLLHETHSNIQKNKNEISYLRKKLFENHKQELQDGGNISQEEFDNDKSNLIDLFNSKISVTPAKISPLFIYGINL